MFVNEEKKKENLALGTSVSIQGVSLQNTHNAKFMASLGGYFVWQVNSKTKYYGNGVIRNNQPIYQGLGELVHTHGNDLFITRGQFNDSNFVSGYVKKIALSEESINDYKTSSNKPSSTYKDCNYKELHKGFFTDSILTSGIIIRKNVMILPFLRANLMKVS